MDNETGGATIGGTGMPRSAPFGSPTGPHAAPDAVVPGVAEERGGERFESDHATALVERNASAAIGATDNDRSGVFGRLVNDDGDIAGLVAYSIYKQNKLDWLKAFETALGRAPQASEITAYIIGEATPRRLATYRHLAEATLAGHGPEVPAPGQPFAAGTGAYRRRAGLAEAGRLTTGLIATYAIIALLFVVAFWFAAHYTVSNH